MIAPGNALIQALFAIAFVIASGYALGRIHQWYRDGVARDEAYRSGYDRASDGMLTMAMHKRAAGAVPGVPAAAVRPLAGEGPAAHLVGHARRRIVAGGLSVLRQH
jgi:hypothetical protein